MSYTYDSHGNRATMTYPNGKTVKYTYDDMNRLIAVKGIDGATTKYEYDALGRRIATDGAKEDTVYAYDEVGNLVSQTTTGAYDLALEYAYDLSGRMTQESRTENGATLTSSYIYDALGQLTGFTRSDGQSETYTYDPVGNMTAKTQNGVSTTMRYNAANQLTQSVTNGDTTTYSYDANGNLTRSENAGGARSYAYNALNLLQSFTREDGYTETYTYNANRLLSTIKTSEDLTTALTWDILYGDGVVISAAQNGQQTSYTYGLERISAKTGSTRTEYVYDGRGSVAAEVSYNNAWYTFGGGLARKNVVSKSYSPFGELLTEQTSGFGYNGEYYNAATGMIYLRARFYAPEMNRFGQKDTLRGNIADGISLNRYLYCQSDPVNFADYNGLQMVNVCVADGGGGGRDNSRYARTTASSTTASNQPPTFREYLAQNNYDPFNPLGRLSTAGSSSNGRSSTQLPTFDEYISSRNNGSFLPSRSLPTVQNITGGRGYSCGNSNTGTGQTTTNPTNIIPIYGVQNTGRLMWLKEDYNFIGFGVQLDGSLSIGGLSGDLGLEAIVYWGTQEAKKLGRPVVAVYGYGGGAVDFMTVSEDIINIADLLADSVELLKVDGASALEAALMTGEHSPSAALTFSIFPVFGSERFDDTTDYTNKFDTFSVGVSKARGAVAWSETCFTVGGGYSFVGGNTRFSVAYGEAYYVQLWSTERGFEVITHPVE